MAKQNKKNKYWSAKKIILGFVGLIVGIVLIVSATSVISWQLDRQKFTALDTQMQTIHERLNPVDPSLEWTYTKGCKGDGTFTNTPHCLTSMTVKKTETTPKSYSDLYTKYKNVLGTYSEISQTGVTSDNPSLLSSKGFVNTESNTTYDLKATKIQCFLSGSLKGTGRAEADLVGTPIPTKDATATLVFSCEAEARDFWYQHQ